MWCNPSLYSMTYLNKVSSCWWHWFHLALIYFDLWYHLLTDVIELCNKNSLIFHSKIQAWISLKSQVLLFTLTFVTIEFFFQVTWNIYCNTARFSGQFSKNLSEKSLTYVRTGLVFALCLLVTTNLPHHILRFYVF